MRAGAFFLPLTLLLVAAGSPAGRVVTPKKNTADYESIMLLHKDHDRADIQIEPYSVGDIFVAHTPKMTLAYVEGRAKDDLVLFQQVLIRVGRRPWHVIWSDHSGGANDCTAGIAHYRKIIRFVRAQGVDSERLLPGFQNTINRARTLQICEFGDFDIDEKFVK
jgi:hypothetical protein